MDDLISRQQAIDALNCEITITGRQNAELVMATIGAFVDRIKALPSAQPEIVHCRDCRYNDGTAYCELHYRDVKGGDFCSWGER